MGKGGCFQFAEASVNFIRSICACLCCVLVAGPVLIIVGGVLLVSKNDYTLYESEYNNAVQKWNNGLKATMLEASGNIVGTSVGFSPQKYDSTAPFVKDGAKLPGVDNSGFNAATGVPLRTDSTVMLATVSPFTQARIFTGVNSTNSTTALTITIPKPVVVTRRKSLYCTSSDKDYRRSCSTKCQNAAPNGCTASYSGSDYCRYSDSCSGDCTWTETQSAYCTVITFDNSTGTFKTSNDASGCIYPFSASDQPSSCSASSSSSGNSQYVFLLSDQDPFYQAQKILADAGMSPGLTEAQQRGLGVGLLAAGIIITVAVCGCLVFIFKRINGDPREKERVYIAFGRPVPAGGFQDASNFNNGNVNNGYQQNPYQQSPYPPGQQFPPPQPYYGSAAPPPQVNIGGGGYPPQQPQPYYGGQPPMQAGPMPPPQGYYQQQQPPMMQPGGYGAPPMEQPQKGGYNYH